MINKNIFGVLGHSPLAILSWRNGHLTVANTLGFGLPYCDEECRIDEVALCLAGRPVNLLLTQGKNAR